MSRLPSSTGPRFVEVTERRQELVVCSRVEWWVSHWDVERKRSRRCAGVGCALCAIGSPKVLRFVMLVVDQHGREGLIELRERHRQVVERIDATVTNGEGVRIVVRKDGSAKNAPVNVQVLGVETVFRREIKLLVAAFGLPALNGASAHEPESLDVEASPLPEKLR